MRPHAFAFGFLCATVLASLAGQAALAQEKRIPRTELPAAVLAAFSKTYPQASIKGATKEIEGGVTYYEIESTEGKQARDLLYTVDGTLSEVEEALPVSALPHEVQASLAREMPKAKITKAEKTTKGNAVTYEIQLSRAGARGSIVVDPSGRVLKKNVPGAKKQKTEREEEENEED